MTQQPHEVIWTLTNAVVVSSSVHVAAELGVADQIGDDPVGVTELASRCGADPDAFNRVLRLLATHGVFAEVGGSYDHTETSRLLRSDHPQSMRLLPHDGSASDLGQPRPTAAFGLHRLPGTGAGGAGGLWPYSRPTRARPRSSAKP